MTSDYKHKLWNQLGSLSRQGANQEESRTQNSEQEHGDVIPVLQKTATDDDAGTWGRGEKADNFSLLPSAFS
ncbi:hypothetical protein [Dendronalium sp. ChiSLP03b]|uniref:hypothetical protein n=1 Tax=Dendronalium sp. ChiSLP03b TaxID=3075381 RepID=UPI002AD2E9B5|nr:hypothetical protein [Dendronalium sp. ChiSLP03b]MDZ8207233.1 hypothetical protein [Dendronalium sp. ChiSLP03b]